MNETFEVFINRFKARLVELFHTKYDINALSLERGLPAEIWQGIMDVNPLSVAVPTAYAGRGAQVKECLGLLAAASYESLPLSLTFGINIALFLEPLAKYGHEDIKADIFNQFMTNKAMGGLMITEPDYGSDALSMRTQFTADADSYTLKGQKHWQGLTGMADYWIVAARKKMDNGELARDIDFFVTENKNPEQHIPVEKLYNNLGLYMIPYGLNTIDLKVPTNQKLQQTSTGIKMMLDILHRSRLQFPGMGMGFIQRMMDEAMQHCENRKVGGQKLSALDSVQFQLSRIQSSFALCSGMCAHSTTMSSIENDVSGQGVAANSMKALVTDLMQEAAQICVQLSGSSGYKLDHIGGRGIVDSRPFQIFEGSNEMLYCQIAEGVVKQMKKAKELNFGRYLAAYDLTARVAPRFTELLDFSLNDSLAQRQLVVLGKAIARLVCLQYVVELTDKGFRQDLYLNAFKHVSMDLKELLTNLLAYNDSTAVLEYQENSDWLAFS